MYEVSCEGVSYSFKINKTVFEFFVNEVFHKRPKIFSYFSRF